MLRTDWWAFPPAGEPLLRRHSLGSASPTRRRKRSGTDRLVDPIGPASGGCHRPSRISYWDQQPVRCLPTSRTSASTSILALKMPAVRACFSYCNPTPPSRAGTRTGSENRRVAVPVPSVQAAAAARKSARDPVVADKPTFRVASPDRRLEGVVRDLGIHDMTGRGSTASASGALVVASAAAAAGGVSWVSTPPAIPRAAAAAALLPAAAATHRRSSDDAACKAVSRHPFLYVLLHGLCRRAALFPSFASRHPSRRGRRAPRKTCW
jgi:hypothetical protein